jgi:chemotaxis protein MotB
MSSREGGNRPIIVIRRRRKKASGGHHGGAWKVAYADFVTAMMAFFLLLWLLNTVTTEQRQGIADYFDTAGVSAFQGGARSIFGGETVTQKGSSDSGSDPAVIPSATAPTPPGTTDTTETAETKTTGPETPQPSGEAASGESSSAVATPAPGDENAMSLLRQVTGANGRAERKAEGKGSEAAPETAAEKDRKDLDAAASELREAIYSQPDLAELANRVIIEVIPEGMRVQLVDELRQPMFALGSANLLPQTRKLLGSVAGTVGKLPNRIVVTGHTDATPFASQTAYGNWELSADRANATRRGLAAAGIQESRFYEVAGKAGTEPLLPEDPKNAANRRISILLLRQAEPAPPTASP